MGLLLNHSFPGTTRLQNNLSATPSTNAPGTTITASGSTNTKGSWSQIVSATTYETYGITLSIVNDSTSATAVANLYDIGVGASSSEQVIVSNLLNTASTNTGATSNTLYYLPLYIPAGTRVAMRKQSNVASKTGSAMMFLHQSSPIPCFMRADGIGSNTADSGGATVVSGSTGTEGSWTSVGSTLAREYRALLPILSTGSDTTMTNLSLHMEVGYSSTNIGEFYYGTNSTEWVGMNAPAVPLYGFYPSGTQMQARLEASGTADADNEVCFMMFY